jgi:hypothetical protein
MTAYVRVCICIGGAREGGRGIERETTEGSTHDFGLVLFPISVNLLI